MNNAKEWWEKIEPFDFLGSGLTFIAMVVTIIFANMKEDFFSRCIFSIALATEAIGCFIGMLSIAMKYKYKHRFEDKELELQRQVQKLNTELENARGINSESLKAISSITEEKRKYESLVVDEIKQMGTAVKNNAIMSNSMLVDIAEKGDDQYHAIDDLSHSTYNDNDRAVKSNELMKKYSTDLFMLFNRYCRNATDEACDLLQSYLSIKNIENCKVALAVELLEEPYDPKASRIEDMKVYTAFRDNKTYSMFKDNPNNSKNRDIGTIKYLVKENTDFFKCLTEDGSFIVNNATKEDHSIKYQSQRGFLDFYNCSMVVPIRIRNNKGENLYFGFVCTDCMNDMQGVDIFDFAGLQYLFMCAQNLGTFLETMDSNWVDRISEVESESMSKNILQLLEKKIYKGN